MVEKLDVLVEEIRMCCTNRESESTSDIYSSHIEKTFSALQSFASLLRLYQTKESVSKETFSGDDREFMEKAFAEVLKAVEKIEILKPDDQDAESIAQLEQEIQSLAKKIQDLLDSQGYRPDFYCTNCDNTTAPKNAIYCPRCGREIDS